MGPGPFVFKRCRIVVAGWGFTDVSRWQSSAACRAVRADAYIVQRFYDGQPTVAAGVARSGRIVSIMTYTSTLDPKAFR